MSLPKLIRVGSSSIDSVGYDADSSKLYVRFRENGKLYVYEDVEESLFDELMRARSKGIFVNLRLRDQYTCTELK